MTGQDFERMMVHAFNDYAETYGKKLVAYRHFQMRYQPQLFDVLVDARPNEFYLALECKSIDTASVNQVYFKKHFTWKMVFARFRARAIGFLSLGAMAFLLLSYAVAGGKEPGASLFLGVSCITISTLVILELWQKSCAAVLVVLSLVASILLMMISWEKLLTR